MSEQTIFDDAPPNLDESSVEQAELNPAWQDPVPNAFRDSPARLASPDAPSHVSDSMPDLWLECDLPLKLFTEYARNLYLTSLPSNAAFPGESARNAKFLEEVAEGQIVPPPLSVVEADDARLNDARGRPQVARYDRENKVIYLARRAVEGAIAETASDDPPLGMPENAKLCLRIVRSFGAYADHCLTEKYTGVPGFENLPAGRAVAGIFLIEWLRENDKADYAIAWRDGQATPLFMSYDASRIFMDSR